MDPFKSYVAIKPEGNVLRSFRMRAFKGRAFSSMCVTEAHALCFLIYWGALAKRPL